MTDQEVRDALVRLASGQWLNGRERQLVVRAMESEKTRADELAAKLAVMDVCEACGDCLEPQPPRCERHVHTESGDPEWQDWRCAGKEVER